MLFDVNMPCKKKEEITKKKLIYHSALVLRQFLIKNIACTRAHKHTHTYRNIKNPDPNHSFVHKNIISLVSPLHRQFLPE